tara:strand:+ start:77 stop:361 length:285 start_codon:yes stop_codon:yes gene_type:complete
MKLPMISKRQVINLFNQIEEWEDSNFSKFFKDIEIIDDKIKIINKKEELSDFDKKKMQRLIDLKNNIVKSIDLASKIQNGEVTLEEILKDMEDD